MEVRPEVNEQDLEGDIDDAVYEAYLSEENKDKEMDFVLMEEIVRTIAKMLFDKYFYKEEE